jgi:uncharacterized protein (DUF2267 family)
MKEQSATGDVFGPATEKANAWIRDLLCAGDFVNAHQAYQVFRAVSHALRDQLNVEESAHLASQIPLVLRGVYFEGWRPAVPHIHVGTPESFYKLVSSYYPGRVQIDPSRMCEAFFRTLSLHITEGEMEKIREHLNHRLWTMFPVHPEKLAHSWQ